MEAITKKPVVHKKPVAAKPPARLASESVAGRHVAKKIHAVKEPAVKHAVKPAVVPVVSEVAEEAKPIKAAHGKSFYAVGRRKTSVTQILLTHGNGTITCNLLPLDKYFQTEDLRHIALQPLVTVGLEKTLNIKAKLSGGGIHSQAESFRHAVARALIALNPESRRTLKKLGFLKRDPRVKERKKPGLKRARRAPQFSKR